MLNTLAPELLAIIFIVAGPPAACALAATSTMLLAVSRQETQVWQRFAMVLYGSVPYAFSHPPVVFTCRGYGMIHNNVERNRLFARMKCAVHSFLFSLLFLLVCVALQIKSRSLRYHTPRLCRIVVF